MSDESNIPKAQTYRGLGQNPNSNLKRAEDRKSLLSQEKNFALAQSSLRLRAAPLNDSGGSSTGHHGDVRTLIERPQINGRRIYLDFGRKGPFYVTPKIVSGGPGIEIEAGWVVYKQAGSSNTPIVHYTTVTALEHAIATAQSVYIRVQTDDRGKPSSAVGIVVADATPPTSIEFIPTVDGTDGQNGDLYYKIASVTITGTTTTIIQYHIGHLEIDVNRMRIDNLGGGARVFKQYNASSGLSEYRSLTEGDGITITERTNDILFDVTGSGKNLNLTIQAIDYDEAGAIFGSPYALYVLYWRNGLYVGLVDPADSPTPLDEITIVTVGT